MSTAWTELTPPRRLLIVGGPSTPDARVVAALATPVIGQFDPAFTTIMDEVMRLARSALLTTNARCFPISALPSAGMEAVLNTVLGDGDAVAIVGSPAFRATIADMVERRGGTVASEGTSTIAAIAPHVDPYTGEALPLAQLAAKAHASGSLLLVDATWSLAGRELRVDDWQLDAVVAGLDYCVGAPSGMTVVTYSAAVERLMLERATPLTTSYLDLLQLQAYWSPERLNHHTAPTSLVYGAHEALRLLIEEGLSASWARHHEVSELLRRGLQQLGLEPRGDAPLLLVRVPECAAKRTALRDRYGVSIGETPDAAWRVGLLGADAQPSVANTLLDALRRVLRGE